MALYHIKTISSHEIEYIVDAKSKAEAEKALETIDCEFAQHHLGESILKVAQVTDEEYLKLFREVNPYNIRWSDDFVLAKIAKV